MNKYKCGHHDRAIIASKEDNITLLFWYEWKFGKQDICFKCFKRNKLK